MRPVASGGAEERVAARVRELAATYEPPDFAHVPSVDAALFLCAVDHKTGYGESHPVGGSGPFAGSALLWELACAAERARPGTLSADALAGVGAERVAELFRAGGESVSDPEGRARLWRDLATGLERDHGGEASALIAASGGRLGGAGGLVALLARYEAYADPLAKKAFLFAKIAERRGWLAVADPESWQVCADNVLMRLALRSGLVEPGGVEEVRAATREAFARVAAGSGVPPPVLDDLLWERGREDPALLGADAGELREPPRREGVHWY
ncbi:MAG TPA: hypothetical protein VFY99_02005 [Solirubrobacterales bacterium]